MKLHYLVILLMFIGRQLPPTSFAQAGKGAFNNLQLTGVPVTTLSTDASGLTPVDNVTVPTTSAVKGYIGTFTVPTFNSSPNRSLSTTGTNNTFTISSTRPSRVTYTINIAFALTLTTSNGLVSLDYSTNGGSTWTTVCTVSNAFSLAVTLSGNADAVLSGDIPAGALVRLYRSSNTNVTITAPTTKQQEIIY